MGLGWIRLTSGADRYMEQLKHAKIQGYLFEQQNYSAKE